MEEKYIKIINELKTNIEKRQEHKKEIETLSPVAEKYSNEIDKLKKETYKLRNEIKKLEFDNILSEDESIEETIRNKYEEIKKIEDEINKLYNLNWGIVNKSNGYLKNIKKCNRNINKHKDIINFVCEKGKDFIVEKINKKYNLDLVFYTFTTNSIQFETEHNDYYYTEELLIDRKIYNKLKKLDKTLSTTQIFELSNKASKIKPYSFMIIKENGIISLLDLMKEDVFFKDVLLRLWISMLLNILKN